MQSGGGTTTSVSSSPNPSVFGQAVTFTALVTSGSRRACRHRTVSGGSDGPGVRHCRRRQRAGVLRDIRARGWHTRDRCHVYRNQWLDGSSGNDSSSPHVVNKSGTAIALASSLNPAHVNQSVTSRQRFPPSLQGAARRLARLLLDKSKTLASVAVGAAGTASYTTSALSQGTRRISASYSGNAAS